MSGTDRAEFDMGWYAAATGGRFRPDLAVASPLWMTGFITAMREHVLNPANMYPTTLDVRPACRAAWYRWRQRLADEAAAREP